MCHRLSPAIAILAILFAASLSASTRLVTTGGADSGDCTVTPCATLTYAIGHAVTDDTINVGPGTFSNGGVPIVVDKKLHVTGAQAGVDARTRVAATESILTAQIRLAADSIVVDGFTITCGTCNPPPCAEGCGIGVFTSSSFSGHAVINNIITGNPTGVSFGSSGALPSLLRGNNIFDNNAAVLGVGITGIAVTNAVVDRNRVTGNSSVQISFASAPPQSPARVTISNNSFPLGSGDGPAVVLIGNDGTVVSGNTVTGGSATRCGQICVAGGDKNTTITGNRVSGAPNDAVLIFEAFDFTNGPNSLTTVNGNTLVNNAVGVSTSFRNDGPVEMHFNRIVGNTRDVAALTPINGENNWFGCNDPITCSTGSFSGSINILPWIVMGISASPSTINMFQTSAVTASFNQNSDGAAISGFPDGTTVSFSASGGNAAPLTNNTSNGTAPAVFTPTAIGPATVSATLDSQTVTTNITVTSLVPAIPPMMLALLAAALGAIALFTMRRIVD